MSCVDREALIAAAVELFYVRLAQVFNGRTVALSGNGRWWTGTWNGGKWSGERYVGAGTVATVVATRRGGFHIEFGYSLENLGSWEDVNGSGEDE